MELRYEKNRIFTEDSTGKLLAEVTFPDAGPGLVAIDHTFVDDSLRGQGVAGALLLAAADTLRQRGLHIRPLCSYATSWFQKHPEYADILEP